MSTNLVLLFHVIPSQDWFAKALRTVGRFYDFIDIQAVEAYMYGARRFNTRCHICFDDGDRTVFEHAYPVLEEMRVPATLFVSPEIVRQGDNFWFQELRYLREHLDEDQVRKATCQVVGCRTVQIADYGLSAIMKSLPLNVIRQIIATLKREHDVEVHRHYNVGEETLRLLEESSLIEIGAHTLHHPVLSNEEDAVAREEIAASIQSLSEMLDREIRYFAYPNGETGLDYGPREEAVLREYGIRLAFTTDTAFWGTTTDPLRIPRGELEGTRREGTAWITAKVLLLPIWERIRRDTEATQRRALKEAGIIGGREAQ
jgi:peptidoglycan/xylan/chitin deacetylase (PgdA/CDA1 family)